MTDFEKLMESMSSPINGESNEPKPDVTPTPEPKPVPKPKSKPRPADTRPIPDAEDSHLTVAEIDALRNAKPISDADTGAGKAPREKTDPAEPDSSDKSGATSDTSEEEKPKRTPLPKADPYIIGFFIVLCIYSMLELFSASSQEVDVKNGNVFAPLIRQATMLGFGIIICILTSRIKIKYIVKFTPLFFAVSCGMMIYALLFGHNLNGAMRSFSFFGLFQIQPPELIKVAAVMIVAYILSRNQEYKGVKKNGVIWAAAVVIFMSVLLFSQGLTNTLLLMGISLSMMLIGGIQWKRIGIVLLIYGALGGCGVIYKVFLSDEGRGSVWAARVERYMSSNDKQPKWKQKIVAENAQEIYGYLAQSHGGITGVGIGNSRETSRLPLAFSDYIYSIVVEDTGFIGGLFLLVIYLSLLGRAGIIASRCDRAFPAMLVMGMAVMIVMQALCHMAINTGVFPVSGQPLPLISQGGTSMLVTCFAFGIMLSVSRYASMSGRKKNPKDSESADDSGALNPSQIRSEKSTRKN